MKKIQAAVLAAAVLIAAAPVASAAEPVQVQNDTFGITLPAGFGEFAQQTQNAKGADGGNIETTSWVSKAPNTGEAIVVSVSKMSGKILDPAKLMASTRDSLLQSLKATLESEEKVEGETPETLLTFKSAPAAFLKSRLIVSDDKLYQILYVGRTEEQRAVPAVGQLFQSFKLAPATQASAAK